MSRTFRFLPRAAFDPVVRLIVTHWILGAMLGMICAALVISLDVAGLHGLLLRADRVAWEGLVLMFGGFAITFGGVVCAGAIMSVPIADDDISRRAGAASAPDVATSGVIKLPANRIRPLPSRTQTVA
jgi:hypothetical protein